MGAAYLKGPTVHVEVRQGCSNKIAFSTRKEAAAQIKRHDHPIANVGAPYHCGHCGAWHITSGRKWAGIGSK